jgi:hypothetical protein
MSAPTRSISIRARVARVIARIDLDVNDGFFFAGLMLAGAGGAMVSLPWTLIAIGTVLAAVGLFGVK